MEENFKGRSAEKSADTSDINKIVSAAVSWRDGLPAKDRSLGDIRHNVLKISIITSPSGVGSSLAFFSTRTLN
jgi:hypothetical protein